MNELGGYEFKELCVGMSATYAEPITEADIVLFAAVSGDNDAIHTNEEFAATDHLQGPYRPRHAVGQRDLGSARQQATRSRRQCTCPRNLQFQAPVRAGDTVRATVTVKELIPEKRRVLLGTCLQGQRMRW